jgi:DNA-directed RNA polymerase subunit beta'
MGLPRNAALKLFAPFVVRNIVHLGGAPHAMDAQKKLADVINGKKDPLVWRALEKTMNERPVLLKRDPVLHKYGIQAFKPRVMEGSTIRVHPLICKGYGADFDGDTMSTYVPITHEAVREAHKMFPSNNLFSEATGSLMYAPSNESVIGLHTLSTVGAKTNHKFADGAAALAALGKGLVRHDDLVHISGKESTPGRALIAQAMPASMHERVLHDLTKPLDTKGVESLLTELARTHKADYGVVVNKVKDLGNAAAFGMVHTPGGASVQTTAHTLSLKDFVADKQSRDTALGHAAIKIKQVNSTPGLSAAAKESKAIQAWEDAGVEMRGLHDKKMQKAPTNLYKVHQAGVKPPWSQYKQMALSPMLMKDSQGRVIPNPITKSYGEGLDMAEYWTHLHGARRGVVRKVQEVRDPGYMTKLLQNTASHLNVDMQDCGTKNGIAMHVSDTEVHDRHLQQDFKVGALHVPAGTLLTPDVVGKMRAVDKNAQIVVRSPLRCDSDKGLCAKCVGLNSDGQHYGMGSAVGVQAVHALGERTVQLTLKEFHTGGVTGKAGVSSNLDRLEQLTYLPEKLPDAIRLAEHGGTVNRVEKDATGTKVWVGSTVHHVGRDRSGDSLATHAPGVKTTMFEGKAWAPPVVGTRVEAGHPLSDPSRGIVDPRQLYRATGSVEKLQNHLTNEIYGLFKDEGVKRRHVETVVKAMTSVTRVKDPGGSSLLRGEVYPLAHVNKVNQDLKDKVVHEPVIKGVNMLPHDMHSDWMAKLQHERLTGTITEAAATMGRANIHGSHPIPGLAYGAEFGLTSEHAAKPGFGHLANVPAHNY